MTWLCKLEAEFVPANTALFLQTRAIGRNIMQSSAHILFNWIVNVVNIPAV